MEFWDFSVLVKNAFWISGIVERHKFVAIR
jgi:hypothetical protein